MLCAGAGKGLLSLTRHVVGGVLMSLSGISSSVSRNLNNLSPRRRPRSASSEGGGLVRGVGFALLKAVTTPISGAMDVVTWTSDHLNNITGVSNGIIRLEYGPKGAGLMCEGNKEGLRRLGCRLDFEQDTYVGEVGGVYSTGSKDGAAVAVILAGEALHVLSGGPGHEKTLLVLPLNEVARWRHLRIEEACLDVHVNHQHIMEVQAGDNFYKFWFAPEGARLVRGYLGRWVVPGSLA